VLLFRRPLDTLLVEALTAAAGIAFSFYASSGQGRPRCCSVRKSSMYLNAETQ